MPLFRIRVPPLAERREDIPDLVEYFMDQISHATGLPKRRIGEDAIGGPANRIVGLVTSTIHANTIERLMILAGGDPEAVMNASMLPPDVGFMVPSMPNGNGGEHLMGLPVRDRAISSASISWRKSAASVAIYREQPNL